MVVARHEEFQCDSIFVCVFIILVIAIVQQTNVTVAGFDCGCGGRRRCRCRRGEIRIDFLVETGAICILLVLAISIIVLVARLFVIRIVELVVVALSPTLGLCVRPFGAPSQRLCASSIIIANAQAEAARASEHQCINCCLIVVFSCRCRRGCGSLLGTCLYRA